MGGLPLYDNRWDLSLGILPCTVNATPGWFLLLTSVVGYWRVKHWEQSIRSASNRVPVTPEDISRDTALRRNIQHVFGFGTVDETNPGPQTEQAVDAEVHRIARDLRASGLI